MVNRTEKRGCGEEEEEVVKACAHAMIQMRTLKLSSLERLKCVFAEELQLFPQHWVELDCRIRVHAHFSCSRCIFSTFFERVCARFNRIWVLQLAFRNWNVNEKEVSAAFCLNE